MQVHIPDDSDFLSFRDQCLGADGWLSHYSKKGVTVWCPQEADESGGGVQKVKVSTWMVWLIRPARAAGSTQDSVVRILELPQRLGNFEE